MTLDIQRIGRQIKSFPQCRVDEGNMQSFQVILHIEGPIGFYFIGMRACGIMNKCMQGKEGNLLLNGSEPGIERWTLTQADKMKSFELCQYGPFQMVFLTRETNYFTKTRLGLTQTIQAEAPPMIGTDKVSTGTGFSDEKISPMCADVCHDMLIALGIHCMEKRFIQKIRQEGKRPNLSGGKRCLWTKRKLPGRAKHVVKQSMKNRWISVKGSGQRRTQG